MKKLEKTNELLEDVFVKDGQVTFLGCLLIIALTGDIFRWVVTHPKELDEMAKKAKKEKRPNV